MKNTPTYDHRYFIALSIIAETSKHSIIAFLIQSDNNNTQIGLC